MTTLHSLETIAKRQARIVVGMGDCRDLPTAMDALVEGFRIGRAIAEKRRSDMRGTMKHFSDKTPEDQRAWALDKALVLAMPDHPTEQIFARARAFLDFVTTGCQPPEADAQTPSPGVAAEGSPPVVEIAGEQYFPLSSQGSEPWPRPEIGPAMSEAPGLAPGSLVFSSSDVSVSES